MATMYERKQEAFRKKMEKLRDKNPNGFAYIIKRGYYYQSGYCGYTECQLKAGIYHIADAFEHVTGCSFTDFIRIVPVDIKKHNDTIMKEIKRLANNIINPS